MVVGSFSLEKAAAVPRRLNVWQVARRSAELGQFVLGGEHLRIDKIMSDLPQRVGSDFFETFQFDKARWRLVAD
jgi:hypothetical protein